MKSKQSPEVIIVMGVSGSGKSTVAQALAAHFCYQFVEGDDFHSPSNKRRMANQQPLTDAMREPWVEGIYHYLNDQIADGQSVVLSFSGLREKHRARLRALPATITVLFLTGKLTTILERITQRKNHFMPSSLLESQFSTLQLPVDEDRTELVSVEGSLESVVSACVNCCNNIRNADSPSLESGD